MCPLSVGDIVDYCDGGKVWKGKVEAIGYILEFYSYDNPRVGEAISWRVFGPKINKTTGLPGKHSFDFNGFEAEYIDGVWDIKARSIAITLGAHTIAEDG